MPFWFTAIKHLRWNWLPGPWIVSPQWNPATQTVHRKLQPIRVTAQPKWKHFQSGNPLELIIGYVGYVCSCHVTFQKGVLYVYCSMTFVINAQHFDQKHSAWGHAFGGSGQQSDPSLRADHSRSRESGGLRQHGEGLGLENHERLMAMIAMIVAYMNDALQICHLCHHHPQKELLLLLYRYYRLYTLWAPQASLDAWPAWCRCTGLCVCGWRWPKIGRLRYISGGTAVTIIPSDLLRTSSLLLWKTEEVKTTISWNMLKPWTGHHFGPLNITARSLWPWTIDPS